MSPPVPELPGMFTGHPLTSRKIPDQTIPCQLPVWHPRIGYTAGNFSSTTSTRAPPSAEPTVSFTQLDGRYPVRFRFAVNQLVADQRRKTLGLVGIAAG